MAGEGGDEVGAIFRGVSIESCEKVWWCRSFEESEGVLGMRN